MSLAILADHMASKGRGPDSMLVHMAPSEVQGLQALAVRHGGSLTINPETGLPEAGFLSKLLPMIIGAALAPLTAGTSLAFLGATPFASALTVGGFEALRTGDIGKGISAGLGAYGGASLGANLASSGAQALGAEATGVAAGEAGALAASEAGRIGMEQGLSGEALEAFKAQAMDQAASATTGVAANATTGELMSAGLDQAKANPMEFLKTNAKPLMYTAAPLLAGDEAKSNMPTTITKPGMIAPYSFDPYSGRYVAGNPYEAMPTRAAEGGLMGMADGGYNPGQLDFVQRSEPVARMASGGIAGYAGGGFTDAQVASYIQNNNLSGQGLQDAAAVFGLNADQLGRAQSLISNKDASIQAASDAYNAAVAGRPDLVEQNLGFYNPAAKTGSGWEDVVTNRYIQDQPGADFAQINAAKQGSGLTNEDLNRSFDRYGYSDALYHVATAPDWKNELGLTGFAGLSSNINAYVNKANALNMTPAEKRARAYDDMINSGMNMKDVVRATGKTIDELFPDIKKVVTPVTTTPITTATDLSGGVSGGGNTYVNPNGTITTRPNIPGMPEGGFTGIGQVRDAYTAGGGSLGYTPYTPKTIEEFNDKYTSRLTGGSKQSYDYLTGKTPYSPTPYTATGEVQKPYAESVLGIPTPSANKMYLFDAATRQYKINPDYAIPTRDDKGKVSYALTNKDVAEYVTTAPSDDAFLDWVTTNNLSAEQIAAATGMPISEVYKRLKRGKPAEKKEEKEVAVDTGGGTGGEANGGLMKLAGGGMAGQYNLGGYSDGGRLLRGPGDGVSDSIPATIGNKRPARLADGEFVVPARIVSELGNGSTEAGARKLYAMMDRVQAARRGTVGKKKVAKNSRADKHLPA